MQGILQRVVILVLYADNQNEPIFDAAEVIADLLAHPENNKQWRAAFNEAAAFVEDEEARGEEGYVAPSTMPWEAVPCRGKTYLVSPPLTSKGEYVGRLAIPNTFKENPRP